QMELPAIPPELALRCRENGLLLTPEQSRLLSMFVGAVIEWNGKINLISRRDEANIWFSHILHSLSLLFYVEIPGAARILDLGTGGGFPGIPLAIARPDVNLVLLDSIRKKTTAVRDIVDRLALTSVTVWTGRAEELSNSHGAERSFDFVFTRAVASLGDLIRWSKPYLKTGDGNPPAGRDRVRPPALVALKGGDLEKEITLARLAGRLGSVSVTSMQFPGSTSLGLEDKKLVAVTF
ncbi:MAG TPA: 16S rRNA (guanine(527)-N(7))-methyltransferase RsmG, partial [Bacteroidota bacterium]|nr:16S rRNA (guanine(527)-N(7))-methyltransferase RsmG [Bacteroidota bacterium]